VASTKLEALLVHVPDVLRRKGGMRSEDVLQQLVKSPHICCVEILCLLWIEAAWFGSEHMVALPIALDPVCSGVLPQDHKCKGFDPAPVEGLHGQCLELNPVEEDFLLSLGKELLGFVGILFADTPMDPIIDCGEGHLEKKSGAT
jgi:hypothetical protein